MADNQISKTSNLRRLSRISDANLITDTLLSNKDITEKILKSQMNENELITILQVFVNVYLSDNEDSKNTILQITFNNTFMSSILNYLSNWKQRVNLKEELQLILMYIDVITSTASSSASYFQRITAVLGKIQTILTKSGLNETSIQLWTEDLILLMQKKSLPAEKNFCLSIQDANIFPDPLDFFKKKKLSPNQINGPYSSVDDYLKTHFDLLREDYISAVREGITKLKLECRKGNNFKANTSITLYERVLIESVEVDVNSTRGICHLVLLSKEDEDRIGLDPSGWGERFLHGSLLYFSPHIYFTSFITATVVDTRGVLVDKEGHMRRAISVSIIGDPTSISIGSQYYMIEPNVFFEPYYQVLKVLRSIKTSEFPLKKYIIDMEFDERLPSYLRDNSAYVISEQTIYLKNIKNWKGRDLNLNESQLEAFKTAITNELTLIQGPPGTGKSHLLKVLLEVLIQNDMYRSAPVFLVCVRNDSLDNILESLCHKMHKVLRLGGQSKSEVIKKCMLSRQLKKPNNFKLTRNIQKQKKKVLEKLVEENGNLQQEISCLQRELEQYQIKSDEKCAEEILSGSFDIIGATTTGAARYHHLMSKIKPEVVIFEEAAEILEAHIIASIPKGCKHLILIGDHYQLQPATAHYDSVQQYNLHISLFERLIKNGASYRHLSEQFRMRPEIASVILPLIYENMTDHSSVQNMANIRGMAKDVFFISHRHPEKTETELLSRWNKHEAYFLLALASYLSKQGYTKEEIVILSGYSAQVKYMNAILEDFPLLNGLQITTIDNYQGKEAEIVLISLVRSETGSIGFLKTYNRVNVAMSRAKSGLYVIGNMKSLTSQSTLWDKIEKNFQRLQAIGEELPLKCSIHNNTMTARHWKDFPQNGGCKEKCAVKLSCGHLCKRYCHPNLSEHETYVCRELCLRTPPCGKHKCKQYCFEPCEPCTEIVTLLLECGHTVETPCFLDKELIECQMDCNRQLPCGQHKCSLLCWQDCAGGHEKAHALPCGHELRTSCDTTLHNRICKNPCKRKCPNGHSCTKLCFEDCGLCTVPMKVKVCYFLCCKKTKPCHTIESKP